MRTPFSIHPSYTTGENSVSYNQKLGDATRAPKTQTQKTQTMKTTIRTTITILALSLLVACSKTPADRITDVLSQCAQVSHKAAALNSNPGAQANYVASSFQSMDVSQCPADFRMAFQAHAFAWQQAAPYLANDSVATAFFEGLAAGATDDPRFIGQAGQQAAYAAQQINQTYYVLTQIAAKYGARIPRSIVGE